MGGCSTNVMCLLLFLMIKNSIESNLTVIHRIDQSANEFWWAARDKFSLSQALCSKVNGSDKCSSFGADTPDSKKPCSCRCLWQASTFWNKCGEWKCVADQVIRQQEGCGILFNAIENSASRLTFRENVNLIRFHVHKQNNQTCDVDETASRYLACNGDWLPLKETEGKKQFVLVRTPEGDTQTLAQHELLIHADFGYPTITGRLIKLAITCAPLTGKPCLLFKLLGNYSCQRKQPLPQSCISSTIVPTAVSSSVPVVSYTPNVTVNHTIKVTANTSSARPNVIKPSSSKLKLQISTSSSLPSFQLQLSASVPSIDAGAVNTDSFKSDKLSNTTIAILCGVAAFVLAVALVLLITASLLRRRNSRSIDIVSKSSGKGKLKSHQARFKSKNDRGTLKSNQVTKHSEPPPPYSPELNNEKSNNEAHTIANKAAFKLELESKLKSSIPGFNFSSRRDSINTNSSVRQLEEIPSCHVSETVDDQDDDSDDYVDEDWGSFSESDGCDNEATEPDPYEGKNDHFNVYDTPEGNNSKSQPTEVWRVASAGDAEEGNVKACNTVSNINGQRLKENPEGFCNYSFQSDERELDADDEYEDENIYEELKEISCK